MNSVSLFKKMIKIFTLILCVPMVANFALAQQAPAAEVKSESAESVIIDLSKKKWKWMAERDLDALNTLLHEKSMFVHMSRSLSKAEELEVIRSGNIQYKQADVHDVSVEIIGNTAILLNSITLLAVVGGNEVTNPFVVTEVYIKMDDGWKLGSLSFTRTVTPN